MTRTITIGLEVTTDETDEALLDAKLWGKATGVFKGHITVNAVVIGGTDKGTVMPIKQATKKATGLKARAAKKTTKKKPKKD